MLSSRLGDPWDPYVQLCCEAIREDLKGFFGGDDDDEDRMFFPGVDLSRFNPDISVVESCYDSEDDSDGECLNSKFRENRNHDCMWGGQCCNHRTGAPPPRPAAPPASAPSVLVHSAHKVVTIQKCVPAGKCSERTDVVVVTNNVRTPVVKSEPNSRSLLLNRTNLPVQQPPPVPQASPVKTPVKREFPTPQSSRPETPQSLSGDDDFHPIPISGDSQTTTDVFHSALGRISAGDWEDDPLVFDDCKRTKEEKASVPSQTDILRLSASAKSDHNYDGSSKNFRLEGLGVDTPSDSEEDEEIDVVSLSERSSSSRSSSCSGSGLPTIPSPSDQEHFEELLIARKAVSRNLKKTITTGGRHKRKKCRSESSDCEDYDEEEPQVYTKHQRTKRQKVPLSQRRKKTNRFGEEEDSQEKRDLHNNMERMRRIDLRNSFEDLKALVPRLTNKDRAAKVVILREATNYCCELGAESRSKYMQVMALRKEQERLRAMVSSLRKAAAMACVKTPKRN